MGAEPFVSATDVGKRAARRARVLLSAKLHSSLGDLECRLRDLSSKGALIECTTPPPVGSEVVFVRGKVAIPARVAWVADKRLGIEFEQPIDEQAMLVQLKHGPRTDIPQFYQNLGRTMSVEERRHVRSWSAAMNLKVPEES
jgi:hypothetical protein